jgi:hypothetical protein
MMDSTTFRVVKQLFLQNSEGRKAQDIEKLRSELLAVHENMHVSEVKIDFNESDPLIFGKGNSPGQSSEYSITIDGECLHKKYS